MLATLLLVASMDRALSLPQLHQGKRYYDGKLHSQDSLKAELPDIHSQFFVQTLDHFNRHDGRTFKQRYFVDDSHWKGPDSGAPVFMCVGGEGPPLDASVLVSSVHCNDMVELAPKHGALTVALEHRYYGPSNPFDDLSTEHLEWLNTEQALGDIATFYQMISDKFHTTSKNKWVTWGGSYPGMLAALARLRYPHLIHASVSSSSPLQAAVDMTGYNDVVAQSMGAVSVGGSQACRDAVVEGHKAVGELLKTPQGISTLNDQFNICAPQDGSEGSMLDNPLNAAQWAGDGVVYLPAQSNDPACSTPYCNIEKICSLLTDESLGTPIDRLAKLSAIQHADACVPVSYEAMIKSLQNPKNPERTWLYQTCTEWGFYQTCEEGSECPYVQGLHTLKTDYDICHQAYNITASEVNEQVAYTNYVYGGWDIMATRILYPNGQIDPWHALGVLEPPAGSVQEPVLWVEGASHHFWTHPTEPTDSEEVVRARQIIWDQVDAWLLED